MDWTLRDCFQAAEILAPICAAVVMGWLSRRFAAKGSVAALVRKTEEIERQLAEGESRFTRLESSIDEVGKAAAAAKEAADEAAAAATTINDVRIGMAQLHGEIKTLNAKLEPVAHFGRVMLEGHLKMGAGQ